MTVVEVPDVEAMEALGRTIGRHLSPGDAVCLVGPLGAGKTTLTRGIAAGLGVEGSVASPTFVIARRHRGPRVDLVHCDAYRLTGHDDFLDVVPDPEAVVTVVEWGGPVMPAIADSWLEIDIAREAGAAVSDTRTVAFRGHGPDWDDRDVRRWLADGAGG